MIELTELKRLNDNLFTISQTNYYYKKTMYVYYSTIMWWIYSYLVDFSQITVYCIGMTLSELFNLRMNCDFKFIPSHNLEKNQDREWRTIINSSYVIHSLHCSSLQTDKECNYLIYLLQSLQNCSEKCRPEKRCFWKWSYLVTAGWARLH